MFLLTSHGLQAYYPSHPHRFAGYLDEFEQGVPYMLHDGEINLSTFEDLLHKVRGIQSDLMVLYFTLRVVRMEMKYEDDFAATFDNVRLALYFSFRMYRSVRDFCIVANVEHGLPDVPHHNRESDWLYEHYAAWLDLMVESLGGYTEAVIVLRNCLLDEQDLNVMHSSGPRLDRLMQEAQIGGVPVRHIFRPINFATTVYPTICRMVSLELRMRMNDKGEMGKTKIASWQDKSLYVTPPSSVTTLLARRIGDHV
jgi:hypothetical protein